MIKNKSKFYVSNHSKDKIGGSTHFNTLYTYYTPDGRCLRGHRQVLDTFYSNLLFVRSLKYWVKFHQENPSSASQPHSVLRVAVLCIIFAWFQRIVFSLFLLYVFVYYKYIFKHKRLIYFIELSKSLSCVSKTIMALMNSICVYELTNIKIY